MDSIKQKWKTFTIQKRLKDLWEEYRKVQQSTDEKETLLKFKQFLEEANLMIRNLQKKEELESILNDTDLVLESVLDYLNKFQEISKKHIDQPQLTQDVMDECVLLAEYILRDGKYRKQVENSHNVLADFLNLVEKAQKSESKVVIVKLLMLFSETLNQRVEFFEQQGFHRLLQILMTRDPQLTNIISKALLHFLSIEELEFLEQESSLKWRLGTIAQQFRKFAFNELTKVFLRPQIVAKQEEEEQTPRVESSVSLCEAISTVSDQALFENELSVYISLQALSRSTSGGESEIIEKIIQDNSPVDRLVLMKQNSSLTESEEIVKEFQVLSGGFKAILDMLLKATTEVQLNLLSTIQSILLKDPRNQLEFKKLNGYQTLYQLITLKNDQCFNTHFFLFLKQIIIHQDIIVNYDAFQLLLDLLMHQQALQVLYDILNINWKNVIIARKLKVNFYLALILLRQYYNSTEIMQLNFENEYLQSTFQGILTHFEFDRQEQSVEVLKIFEEMNALEGVYSLEFEAIQSQLCLVDQPNFQTHLNLLFKISQQKLKHKCKLINSFDHLIELVFRNFSLIFIRIYKEYKNSQQGYVNFIQILQIINSFIKCDHKTELQDEFIKNLVSQNRCEQVMKLLSVPLSTIQQTQILELFDFEIHDLALTHLQYRVNQLLFEVLQIFTLDQTQVLYLCYSQYEMFKTIEAENPLNLLFKLLEIQSSKSGYALTHVNNISMFLCKVTLEDQNFTMIDSLIVFFKNVTNADIINTVLVAISKNLPQYLACVNLYPSLIQLVESLIARVDAEQYLDFVFSSEIMKRLNEEKIGQSYSDLLSLITLHSMFQGSLYDKMVQQEYLTNALSSLSYTASREQAIKLAYTLYLMNQKSKNRNQMYSSKQRYFALIQKFIGLEPPSQQLCNTVYKLIFWNFDSYHMIYPENTSSVSSVMARSEFAEQIVKMQKSYLENKQPIQHIVNLDMLELFFQLLAKHNQENYTYEILKIFESILDIHNMNILLESNIIQSLTKLYSSERINNKIQLLIRKLITFDLQKSQKQSKIVDILKKYNCTEIIIDYLRMLQEEPVILIEAANYLKNFANLINQLDELVGFNEEVEILLLSVINSMVSKNSPEVRSIIKSLGLLDIRDTLAFQSLRYNLAPDQLMSLLSGVPFQQFCSSRQFKEMSCIPFLLKRLLQHQHFGLQMLIIKILKYDISHVEDNRKFVAKILNNEALVSFFYQQKKSAALKCFEQERQNQPDLQSMTVDSFIQQLFSEQFEDERKQIDLHLEKLLIPVENEFKKQQLKLNQKKINRLQKLEDQAEIIKTSTLINEWELKIQSRLKKSQEKYKLRSQKNQEQFEQQLAEGENQWFKLCVKK